MKYYRWNLLVNCGFGMCNIILGTALLFVKSDVWLIILGIITAIVFITSNIIAMRVRHDIYDEASIESELYASKTTNLIILLIFAILMLYTFCFNRPVEKIYPKICILYGIIYMLPAVCFAYYEKKTLKGIAGYESEE